MIDMVYKESYEELEAQGIEFSHYGVNYREHYHVMRRVEKFFELVEEGVLVPDEQVVEAFFFSTLKRLAFIFDAYPKTLHALAQVENAVRAYAVETQNAVDPKGVADRNLKALKDKPVFKPDPVMDAENPNSDTSNKFTFEIVAPK